jgi:hypothetical protein
MRTKLRSKATLLVVVCAVLVATPVVAALADIVQVNDVNVGTANASKAPGATGIANVWLEPTNNEPSPDVNQCNVGVANDGFTATVTLQSSDINKVYFGPANNKSATTTTVLDICDNFPENPGLQNAAADSDVSYTVDSNAAGGSSATISVTNVTGGKTQTTGQTTIQPAYNKTDTLIVNITAPPNTAPTIPGTPGLASGSSTPNQGGFTLDWAGSTDDGQPAGSSVTYTLQHKDANDAGFTDVAGATNLSTNSYTFPAASKEAEGTWTYQVKAVDAFEDSGYATSAVNLVKVDRSAPSQPNANFNKAAEDTVGGWYKDSVIVSYNGSTDPALADNSAGSGIASYSAAQTFSTSGSHNYSDTATDHAGNVSSATTGQVKVDTNNPTFGNCPTAGPFLVNSGPQSVGSISASDSESGVNNATSTLSGSVDTSSPGTKTVTFTAKDNVGHLATTTCNYNVNTHTFIGFSSPVDNPSYINVMKAGQAVPLKWQLKDASGNPVTNLQSVTVTVKDMNCTLGTTADQVEEYAAGSSSLQNLGGGYYQFNWKSPTSYAKSCKTLTINGVGVQQSALFQFTK